MKLSKFGTRKKWVYYVKGFISQKRLNWLCTRPSSWLDRIKRVFLRRSILNGILSLTQRRGKKIMDRQKFTSDSHPYHASMLPTLLPYWIISFDCCCPDTRNTHTHTRIRSSTFIFCQSIFASCSKLSRRNKNVCCRFFSSMSGTFVDKSMRLLSIKWFDKLWHHP